MRKYSLKKLLPWIIVIGCFAVLVATAFCLAPHIDSMIKGGSTVFQLANFDFIDAVRGTLVKLVSFETVRSIISFSVTAAMAGILLIWLIVILAKRQFKKLIYWFIQLIVTFVFCLVATFVFAGCKGEQFIVDGGWILKFGFNKEALPPEITLAPVGAIILIVAEFLSACSLLLIIISFIVDLVPEAPKFDDDEVEGLTRSIIGEDEIRGIVHDECEMLFLRFLKAQANVSTQKEENHMFRKDHVDRDVRETDDEYYKRMISELGMFGNKKPVEEPVQKPVPQPVRPAPAVKPAPVIKPAPAVVAAPASEKIVRIPFEKRIVTADKEMKEQFNELKSEILSYGVKSRVSNSGDTFRLHTVTYVKITIAGKSLKLYIALNPKDYKDSTLPIGDASNKSIYKEIPLVFKVRSGLSLRRAKQLIADAMAKGGLTQGEVVAHDWVKDIKNGNY